MKKRMKKAAVIMAAAVMTITSLSGPVSANTGMGTDTTEHAAVQNANTTTKYVAASDGAKVRREPSFEGEILMVLAYNEAVETVSLSEDGWYRVIVETPDEGTCMAYVFADLLSETRDAGQTKLGYASGINEKGLFETNNAGTPSYVKTQANTPCKTRYTVQVDGYLALRSEPAFNYANEFAQLHTGDVVNVKENYGTYWCVYVPATGLLGFVNSNYLV